jgi:hypothetical protein
LLREVTTLRPPDTEMPYGVPVMAKREITMLLRPDRANALVPPGDHHAVARLEGNRAGPGA